MLRPSYTDLLSVINKDGDDNSVTASRYSIVIAASKRARQLVDHAEPLVGVSKDNKPVSIAVNELYQGKLRIVEDGDIVCGENYHPEEETEENAEQAAVDTALEDSEEIDKIDEEEE